MAAGLITIAGTSGQVLIEYLDSGSDPHSLVAGIGTLYLEDDGSDYTWTTLSGDATASSGDVTLVEVDTTCYILSWEQIVYNISISPTYSFDAVILGAVTTTIEESFFPFDSLTVATNINAAGLEYVKATAYKIVYPPTETGNVGHYLILKVVGDDIPYLRIKNSDDTFHIYLMGETSTCLPAGYTEIPTCELGSSLPL